MDPLEPSENTPLNLEEILRRQLSAFAISGEIGRVVTSALDLPQLLGTLGLGFQEMLGFPRVAVFEVDSNDFSLRVQGGAGIDLDEFRQIRFGLEFIAGEYGDAVFRNRHVIIEKTDESDPFRSLGSTQYAAFPIVGRLQARCWEEKRCGCTACVCFEQPGSVCWATEGAALFTGARYEDDRRRACVRCPVFKCLGVLWLDLTGRTMLTGDEVSIISSIAAQAGLALENFRIHGLLQDKNQELLQSNEALEAASVRIRRDLERAKGIQKKLLPSTFPEGMRNVAAHYAAQTEVGGDYYDCFEMDHGRLGMVVADVSGHGVAAALVMSMFKTLLRQVAMTGKGPAATLDHINQVFLTDLNADMFVTVFFAIWDPQSRILQWTNAGHTPILLQHQDTGVIEELKSRGLFIGMLEETHCTDARIHIPDPARILLYTDGILEAQPLQGSQYGSARLSSHMRYNAALSPAEYIENLMQELEKHTEGAPGTDDITLLCCDL